MVRKINKPFVFSTAHGLVEVRLIKALAILIFVIFCAGCCGKDTRIKSVANVNKSGASTADAAALPNGDPTSPQNTVETYIEIESESRAAERVSNDDKKRQLLTGDALKGIEEARKKGMEYVVRTDMVGKSRAETLTKKRVYYLGADTGRPERDGEYIERKFILRLEGGVWKIGNILERRRSPDEFDGFVPRWNPALK